MIEILGSPQHNPHADDLQRRLDLPFQFISLTPERPPEEAILCLYDRLGQTYTCTLDPTLGEIERAGPPPSSGQEYDYGLLLVGEIEDENGEMQSLVWAGGIHEIGTLGARKWAAENLERYGGEALGNVCFLIRVGFSPPPGGSLDAKEPQLNNMPNSTLRGHTPDARCGSYSLLSPNPELVRGPCPWQPRPQHNPRIGLLCDLGNVLVGFERRRLADNLRHLLGVQPSAEQFGQIQALRMPFESGEMEPELFLAKLRRILDLPERDEAALELAWCDIFWRNEPVIAFFKKVFREKYTRLVLVSNTEPLRLAHCIQRLGLGSLFSPARVVVSSDAEVRPKGQDPSMLSKALSILEREFQGQSFQAVFIDDVRAYFEVARQAGLDLGCIHYRSLPQLVYELGRYGLYLSMTAGNCSGQ